MWENIAGAIRYSRPCGFNIAGASAPVTPAVPTPMFQIPVNCILVSVYLMAAWKRYIKINGNDYNWRTRQLIETACFNAPV